VRAQTPEVEHGGREEKTSGGGRSLHPRPGRNDLKMRGQIEAYIDAKIAQIKNSRDGRDLPVEVIRQSLTRNDSISDSESGR